MEKIGSSLRHPYILRDAFASLDQILLNLLEKQDFSQLEIQMKDYYRQLY
jgi:hypothetical protein